MFVEIFALQNFSSVNLNRDDANMIKTIEFGGFERQRVSSQCFKRAMREHASMDAGRNGREAYRSRRLLEKLCSFADVSLDDTDKIESLASFLEKSGFGKAASPDKKKGKGKKKKDVEAVSEPEGTTSYPELATLFFSWEQELEKAAALLKDHQFDAAKAANAFKKEVKNLPRALDIALFGRMAASGPELNVEAAAQVSHSISANQIRIEDDFFTALDDLALSDETTGSGMMGNTQLGSPCLFRYGCLSLNILKDNLGSAWDVERDMAVQAFLKAFALAVPGGKSKSTAPSSRPDFILVAVGKDQPLNPVNAFLKPVTGDSDQSMMDTSISSLLSYLARMEKAYKWSSQRTAHWLSTSENSEQHKELCPGIQLVDSLDDLLKASVDALGAL